MAFLARPSEWTVLNKKSAAYSFSDILAGSDERHIDDIFPYFLTHARKVFPHLECMEDLRMISDLSDPTNWYPEARSIQRKVIFHSGPTNSGKTYHALERFFSSKVDSLTIIAFFLLPPISAVSHYLPFQPFFRAPLFTADLWSSWLLRWPTSPTTGAPLVTWWPVRRGNGRGRTGNRQSTFRARWKWQTSPNGTRWRSSTRFRCARTHRGVGLGQGIPSLTLLFLPFQTRLPSFKSGIFNMILHVRGECLIDLEFCFSPWVLEDFSLDFSPIF